MILLRFPSDLVNAPIFCIKLNIKYTEITIVVINITKYYCNILYNFTPRQKLNLMAAKIMNFILHVSTDIRKHGSLLISPRIV